jgi:hypothetical protein
LPLVVPNTPPVVHVHGEASVAVSVPLVVTGDPVTVNTDGIDNPTLVTVPHGPVAKLPSPPIHAHCVSLDRAGNPASFTGDVALGVVLPTTMREK